MYYCGDKTSIDKECRCYVAQYSWLKDDKLYYVWFSIKILLLTIMNNIMNLNDKWYTLLNIEQILDIAKNKHICNFCIPLDIVPSYYGLLCLDLNLESLLESLIFILKL